MERYVVPARQARAEIEVQRSRFVATAGPVFSVEEARAFVEEVRAEFAAATHNVPAYLVGAGPAVIAHCHDDGEPAGTAGRPVLAVLQGSGLGDVAAVVTRFYGGTKLGKGGLVRAYADAARTVLATLPRARKVPTKTLAIALPYALFERGRRLIDVLGGEILEETFAADVLLHVRLDTADVEALVARIADLSNGAVTPEIVGSDEATLLPLSAGIEPEEGAGSP